MTDAERESVVGITGKLLGTLPVQFLVLVLLNVLFIGSLLWFLNEREVARERVIGPIIAACLKN